MRNENDIEQLRRQVAKAKGLVRQTAMKVEDLEASVEEIYCFDDRLFIFPRQTPGKLPVRLDRSADVEDFILT